MTFDKPHQNRKEPVKTMITQSIDLLKIDKNLLKSVIKKDGTKALYLNLICWPNKDGRDQYDNDGTVKQSLSKAQRDEGVTVVILGNYQDKGDGNGAGGKASPAPITPHNEAKASAYAPADKDDDLPF